MKRLLSTIAIAYMAIGASANAATIIGAVSATASSTIGAPYTIERTIDQSGLSVNYVSGVTDFDAYMALNPIHSLGAENEWFSAQGVNSATVSYDLGAVFNVDRIALWNEDAGGFTEGMVYGSADGVNYSLISSIFPTNHPYSSNYPADVFAFATTALRYVAIDLTGCPQIENQTYDGCSMGEIAFSAVDVIPVPAGGFLIVTGIAALGGLARRRKASKG